MDSEVILGITIALITGSTTIIVAWIQFGVRRPMQTNHESRSLGDAVDKLTQKIVVIIDQNRLMQSRVDEIEKKLLLREIYEENPVLLGQDDNVRT